MPASCAAWGCTNHCTIENRSLGITFHSVTCSVVVETRHTRRSTILGILIKRRRITTNTHILLTYLRFPKDKELRRQWEVVIRREGSSSSKFSVLCSGHFKPEDFDRSGQTVRIRDGAAPSAFCFPTHLQRPVATRDTQASMKAKESLSVHCSHHFQETDPPLPNAVSICSS
ncbi:THAP domain-containing protein 2-like [Ctenopharyngodon idella]|uniref:THAP domain-containing protein 2-like n=1 Tax=Ctenopharyngodon idella TaxID=7959 RepID=UPI002230A148|nr:THAP domain-containing protein 2-like [Ctenopharyngodon idella]